MRSNHFKLFFLILCYLSFTVQGKDYSLSPTNQINEQFTSGQSFKVTLDPNSSQLNEIIRITLWPSSGLNPLIIVSKDDETCTNNRLYSAPSSSDSTYVFFKTEELIDNNGQKSFYVCLIEQVAPSDYHLNIANEDKAYLPLDTQVSYYVAQNNTQMTFSIKNNQDKIIDYFNIWVKGQNIKNATINSLQKEKFQYGYVFYGTIANAEYELEIEAVIGDFITVGSISFYEGKPNQLKENSKEITSILINTYTQNEICFPIEFNKDLSPEISGKVYTNKAKTYYKKEDGNKIDMTSVDITNGILNDLNVLGGFGEYGDSGYFCLTYLDSNNKQPIIFSIQMTSNRNISLIHPVMFPGEIRRHFLLQGEIAVFYGFKPKETANEVNLNVKAFRGFPEMYYDECKTFPNCQYNASSLVDKINPFPSNRMIVYSFYLNDDDALEEEEDKKYDNYNPITSFQPVMIVYCSKGGRMGNTGLNEQSLLCEFDTLYFSDEDSINIYEGSTFSQ